jgi:predicted Ser/Thr protein kinase
MQALKSKLRDLKLAGIVKSIETRNKYALENNISYLEFIESLIEDEYANRLANSFQKRFKTGQNSTRKKAWMLMILNINRNLTKSL